MRRRKALCLLALLLWCSGLAGAQENREAMPLEMVKLPALPPELRKLTPLQVTVAVVVEADGSCQASLKRTSGYPELDEIALDTLSRWTWQPALRKGKPVRSTRVFRYDIEVD